MGSNNNAQPLSGVHTIPCAGCGSMEHNFHQCLRRALLQESTRTQLEWIYEMLERVSPPVTPSGREIIHVLRVELSRIFMQYPLNLNRYQPGNNECEMNIKIRHKLAKQGARISHRRLKKCKTKLFH